MPGKLASFTSILMSAISALSAAERPPLVLPLWPDLAPAGEESVEDRSSDPLHPDRSLRNVTFPELTVTWPRDAAGNAPAVVICPGGGYEKVNIDKGHDTAKWLNDLGVVAAVLKYRLPVPGTEQPAIPFPIQDGQQAIRLLRLNAREWGIDPNRVGIVGSSAGGHLASTLATHSTPGDPPDSFSPRPDFQMLLYPVISFDAGIAHAGSRKHLLGENPTAETVRLYSNELQVTKDTPPAFIVHAEDDEVVLIANSLRYRDALQRAGVPVELLVLKTGGHGFYLGCPGTDSERWTTTGAAWLKPWINPSKDKAP